MTSYASDIIIMTSWI